MSDKPESAVYEIERLRQWGNLEGALTKLLQAIPEPRCDLVAYRFHLLGKKCLLLDWAFSAKRAAFDRQRFEKLFELTADSARLIGPRIDILEAIRVDHNVDRILELLTNAVETYATIWRYRKQPFVANAEEELSSPGLQPAFMARLPVPDQGLFRQLADKYGWLHPGLLLAGETWAYVLGKADDWPQDHVVQTWALLERVDSPDGFAPRLRVERVPGGCGALYPHPACSGYLTTDGLFQQSLQNAWWAAIGRTPRPWEYDFRWSLEFVHHDTGLPLDVRATDRSMEVAMACALRAAQAGEQLNEDEVVTAVFAKPGTDDMSLDRVGRLMKKLLAPQFVETALTKKIRTIVVAPTQPEVIQPGTSQARETLIADSSVTLVPAADFDAAHGHLGRWAKMTQLAKQRIFERAEKILKQQCDPYILPPLSREDPEGKLGVDPLGRPKRRPLSDEELQRIVRGELPRERNRLFVQGDSGMGKSMLLVYCEQQIAQSERLILPLRLGAGPVAKGEIYIPLSGVDWNNQDTALKFLVDAVLYRVLPEYKAKDLQEWLRYLVSCNSVVFLLDALDQTENVNKLPTFLQSNNIAECVALMTGRPETGQTKRPVRQIDWDEVWTDPFEEKQQLEFLGAELADRLIPKTEDISQYSNAVYSTLPPAEQANQLARMQEAWVRGETRFVPAGESHKLRWKELLKVPILLRELRTLARTEELDGLKNRESVYARSLDRLIDKGLESDEMTSKPLPNDWTPDDVRMLLADVAWETIHCEASWASKAGENFIGIFKGQAFAAFKRKYASILDAIGQIGITILESVRNKRGYRALAFRHFSYCEYFAGMKLASLPSQERTAIVQQHARDPRWRWIFRYALSREEPDGNQAALAELAHALIRYGNPFLVYDAIEEDKVDLRNLPRLAGVSETVDLDRLCRWLVHRDFGPEGNYTGAWDESAGVPVVDSGTLDILESLFDPQYRNSRCLHPAWELLEQSDDPRAGEIRQNFLDEFPRLLRSESKQGEIARRLVNNFVRCPKDPHDDGVPFWMGAADGEQDAEDDERPQHQVIVTPFKMQSTLVTNEQFELFDRSKRRDRFSPDDLCPVVYVNWYMANMFCLWLGPAYRLPTEAEWEFGCRARPGGDRKTTRFWTGDDDADLAEAGWYRENWDQKERRTHVVGKKLANAFGLYDVHGNVWEWCSDYYDARYYGRFADTTAVDPPGPETGSYRVFRGGCWFYGARGCRSASRSGDAPDARSSYLGFRLAFSSVDQSDH